MRRAPLQAQRSYPYLSLHGSSPPGAAVDTAPAQRFPSAGSSPSSHSHLRLIRVYDRRIPLWPPRKIATSFQRTCARGEVRVIPPTSAQAFKHSIALSARSLSPPPERRPDALWRGSPRATRRNAGSEPAIRRDQATDGELPARDLRRPMRCPPPRPLSNPDAASGQDVHCSSIGAWRITRTGCRRGTRREGLSEAMARGRVT